MKKRNKILMIVVGVIVLLAIVLFFVKKAKADDTVVTEQPAVETTATVEQPANNIVISDVVSKLPAFKNGIFYNALDSEINYVMTVPIVANWKGFAVEFGYSPEITGLGILSYQLVKLKDLGVTLPILDLIECNIGIGAGAKRIQLTDTDGGNEFVWGATATLINIKW